MLKLVIDEEEYYNESTNTFEIVDAVVVELEHSLLSLSKWEAKHQKPFLASGKKTADETLDYVACMVIDKEVTKEDIKKWPPQTIDAVNKYINSEQSATTFGEMPDKRGRGEVITSELIYYWMVAYNIPFSCETWHLNRLFSLIKIANIKNSKERRMSKSELAARNRELNAKRKAELGTKG